MDAFDPIRQEAAALHRLLVSRGADPLKPMSLVLATAAHLDLEVVPLHAGDPALNGARALYDEQSGTICCEDRGDEGDRALLIAHEIGHDRLHAGSACCSADDIDATRSIESAPVGLQRVEDYGARERRELQANVFARELVLPRDTARGLHDTDGLTASDIASRMGLPIALVRQQLFDSLLLPPVAPAAAPVAATYVPRPDPSQDRAAAHRGAPFLLQAGPGTGKTRTLVKRVRLLLEEGVDPASMLILTFSNRAAGELSERLTAVLPDVSAKLWIGTFHSFGLDLVRRHHDLMELKSNPSLFDRSDAIAVLEEILPTLRLVHYRNLWDPAMVLREMVTAFSRAKDEMVDASDYLRLATEMAASALTEEDQVAAAKCIEIAEVYDLYDKALRAHGGVDFGDLIMRPARLLEEDLEVRTATQLRHRHVLVDEYQDVNRASARLLKAVCGDGSRLWVVGDARQSIYRFRGASSANMARFTTDYPGAVVDQLAVNYRSTPEIVQTFVGWAPSMGASQGMLPLALEADRASIRAIPEIRRFDTLDDEVAGVAASVRELQRGGVLLREQAVLCRSNRRLNEIAAGLENRGIAVLHLGSLFEREEVRDLLALLSLAVEPFGDGLVRVAAMSRYAMSLQDVHSLLVHLRVLERPPLEALQDIISFPEVSTAGRIAIERLADDLKGLRHDETAWEFLSTYLLDRTDIARALGAASTIPERMRGVAVWQFLNFVRDQSPVGHGLPIQRTLDRVRQMVLLAEERDLRQVPAAALHLDAVRLMTVHGSKGLEFEAVHVPGLTVSSLPASYSGQRCPPPVGMIEGAEMLSPKEEARRSHDLEEECLFFVALSRARTQLRLCLARKQPNGNNRGPSPFLDQLPVGRVIEVASPAVLELPDGAAQSTSVSIAWPAQWRLTDARIGSFGKCPRRFFYTHVLGLRSARKMTAFSLTHDCLYEFLDWLAKVRPAGIPSLSDAEAAFDEIWMRRGPVQHAFAADYRGIAGRLIGAVVKSSAGRRFRVNEPLMVTFTNGTVAVMANEIAELADGTVAVRRVRTGYKRTKEYDGLEYALYHFAAQEKFGRTASVQALHLTDEAQDPVALTSTVLANRRKTIESHLKDIAAGEFPTDVDPVTCPRCPHFFICAATPAGPLRLP